MRTGFANHVTFYPVSSDKWFFGFDCGHYGDDRYYWNQARVEAECIRFADQLIEYK
jgi:hypothetical protein